MEKIITQCPHCKAKFKLGNDKLGKKIRCPKCKGVFAVQELKMKPKPTPKPVAQKTPSTPPPPEAVPAQPFTEEQPAPPIEEEQPPTPAAQEVVPLDQRPRPLTVRDFMETQHMRFTPEKAKGIDLSVAYTFAEKGKDPEYWTLKVHDGTCEITEGADPSAKIKIKAKPVTYLKFATGQLDFRIALMLGKVKVKGGLTSLPALRECFRESGLKDWK
jgi:predicted Zn finger-like uncharacterized protein